MILPMTHTTRHVFCVILSLTLLLSMAGCGAAEPSATETSTDPTNSAPTVTQPEQTQATESVPTETVPITTTPTETEPPVTEPPVTEPPATEPLVTQPAPTTPPETEPVQVEYEYGNHYVRILNYTPAPGEHGHIYWNEDGVGKYYHGEFIFDVDYKTITHEIWCGWNWLTQTAFRSSQTCSYATDYEMTPDENYYFDRVTLYEDYACGFEGHYCTSQAGHDHFIETLAKGCRYCAQSDCPSFFARNQWGFNETDRYLCPEYDVYRDPDFYCQDCGRPTHLTNPDHTQHCFGYIRDMNCYYCGVWVEAHACHTCKQEDIDAFQASQS